VWVKADKNTLKDKIDKRVLQMVKEGGLMEVFEIFNRL